MEFFASVRTAMDADALFDCLTVESLPQWCAGIDTVLEHTGDEGRIFCLWGEFTVRRERIRGGVRFTLPGCPNALAWTITTGLPPDPKNVVIHCTINRSSHDPDFIESIESFVADWAAGLASPVSV
jgi:hypothetical protein